MAFCIPCTKVDATERQRRLKLEALEYKGGSCEKCGYDKCPGALGFHHLDPSQKDFGISRVRGRNLNEIIKKELDKCMLLCANCHAETHALVA